MSVESQFVRDPQDFLDRHLSKGYLGDIRRISMEDALARLAVIARERELGRAGIALLVFRQEDAPGEAFLPPDGAVSPLYPSPDVEERWQSVRDHLIHIVGVPGHLHIYDTDAVALPI